MASEVLLSPAAGSDTKIADTNTVKEILRHITSELSGVEMRSIFTSGGGPQGRNVLERFVISLSQLPFHAKLVE